MCLGTLVEEECFFFSYQFDNRYPVTSKAAMRYKVSLSTQKTFTAKLKSENFEGVLGLDYHNPNLENISLRQVIMSTLSEGKNERLFVGVEENWDNSISLIYQQEDTIKASKFIAAIPKIIENSYGNQAWKWFDKEVFDK